MQAKADETRVVAVPKASDARANLAHVMDGGTTATQGTEGLAFLFHALISLYVFCPEAGLISGGAYGAKQQEQIGPSHSSCPTPELQTGRGQACSTMPDSPAQPPLFPNILASAELQAPPLPLPRACFGQS